MTLEDTMKVEVESECPPEPPVAAVEKAIVPVEPHVHEEKPTDDTKALAIIESNISNLHVLYSFCLKNWCYEDYAD